MPHPRTLTDLESAVTAELDPEYTLVYRDQGDTLPADVAAALVSGAPLGETDGGERLSEWEGEARYRSASDDADQLAKDILDRWAREDDADLTRVWSEWQTSRERDSVIEEITDRDRSTWFTDLVNAHGAVLLRVAIPAMGDDARLSDTRVTPEQVLDLLDFPHTPRNLASAAEVVDNAVPEFNYVTGHAVIAVDLAEFLTLPDDPDAKVDLIDPHVWLGNPAEGNGWCSDNAFTGTLTVRRGDLRTDADAPGYSWSHVMGGANPSNYTGTLKLVAPVTRTTEERNA